MTQDNTENIYKNISITYYDLDQLYSRKDDIKQTMLNYVNRESKFEFVDEFISIGKERYYLVFKLKLIK